MRESLLVILLLIAPHGLAEKALVVGSFADPANAAAEASRLSRASSMSFQVVLGENAGRTLYRVIAPLNGQPAEDAKQRLQSLGVQGSWATDVALAQRVPAREEPSTDIAILPAATVRTDVSQQSIARAAPAPLSRVSSESAQPEDFAEVKTVRLDSFSKDVSILVPQRSESEVSINIDGRIDESIWAQLPGYDNMLVMNPDTLGQPRYETDVRLFYTDKGLYIAAVMQQPKETLVSRLSSRDQFLNRDEFGVTLDTSGQGLYGYWFASSLGGSMMDGKVAPERQFSREWDGPWSSATAELENGWSTEMFLPWSMMTMGSVDNDGERRFGFFFMRNVAYLDERWSWPALPFTSKRFMSALPSMRLPQVESKQQVAFFPYVSAAQDEIYGEDEYRVGADFSWRPSSDLQVTASINPDFGAVESDDVVVNLTAFETFFAEKRLFFLEGREVFSTTPRSQPAGTSPAGIGSRQTTSTFTGEPTTLLNTRRIGGAARIDVPDGLNVPGAELGRPTDLLGAAKVTGQKGGIRYGLLGAMEDDVVLRATVSEGENAGERTYLTAAGRDFGVARLLYEQTGDGRRSIGYLGTMTRYADSDAVVHGIDGHWLSKDGAWRVDSQLVGSDVDDVVGYGGFSDVTYVPRQGVSHGLQLEYLDKKLDVSDLGYIRRNNAMGTKYIYSWSTGRGLERLRAKKRSVMLVHSFNLDGQLERAGYFFRNSWTFKNLSEIRTEFDYFPKRWDDRNSFGNGSFRTHDRIVAEVGFGSNTSKPLSFSALIGVRQEELSDWTTRTSLGLTYRPSDRFSLDVDLNYFDRKGWLLHDRGALMATYDASDFQPRVGMDIFLTAKQQIRFSLQWAGIRASQTGFYEIPLNEGDLVNIADPIGAGLVTSTNGDFALSRLTSQLRYRWEIGPLSDLFVVYTRGSNLSGRVDDSFDDLFDDALREPVIDVFVVKLRYRFGN
ncbi:MAG: hypothetical protein CMP83_05430 [Gammaproteobacteria bacterium]|nr:hypothetical protein [Gammaproteobacteria bacterium]